MMSAALCSKELALTIYSRRAKFGDRNQEGWETLSNSHTQGVAGGEGWRGGKCFGVPFNRVILTHLV